MEVRGAGVEVSRKLRRETVAPQDEVKLPTQWDTLCIAALVVVLFVVAAGIPAVVAWVLLR